MKILYEDTLPHAGTYLSQLGDTQTYSWQTLTPDDLVDVDILAIRSTTKITPQLLSKANKLKAVATATAGKNHMDIAYLEEKNIDWYAAGGCNAIAVAQYVVSAIMWAHEQNEIDFRAISVGIVGAGNVGTALSVMLDALSIDYVLCDPPIENNDARSFVSLDEALQCDIVSLHVPFTQSGKHATSGMVDESRLREMKNNQWLINACRGEVIDESALLALKCVGEGPQLVLDVWDNEPDISTELMSYCRLATPHIAGHTDEGKIRGTQMVYDFIREKYVSKESSQPRITLDAFLPELPVFSYGQGNSQQPLSQFLLSIYDIRFDHRHFVENMAKSNVFSSLRKQYRGRREYAAYSLENVDTLDTKTREELTRLGFFLRRAS